MKKLSLVLTMMLFVAGTIFAQRSVSGTITDDTGEALVGATVVVKGTTTGVSSDYDGKYTISVPDGQKVLVFSYTGFKTMEMELGASNTVDATMSEGLELTEVVVTALGIKREKKSLGYATQEVNGDEVTKVKDANFINSLSGKVAGVDIKRSSTLGGSSNIVIRGYKSLLNNNQALFVVDGIPIGNSNTNTTNQRTGRGGYDYGNAAMDINPEDIESINILKGAAASALYGSRAANGVVQITTKKGKKNKGLGVTVSSGVTFGTIDESTFIRHQNQYGPGYSTIQGWYSNGDGFDTYDFGNGDGSQLSAAVYEDASFGPEFDPNKQVYSWQSWYPELDGYGQTVPYVAGENTAADFYETSTMYNTNVSVDGGGDRSNYRLSFTNLSQNGIVPNSRIERNSISFAGGYDLTDKLKVSSTVNYILTDGRGRYGTGYDNRNFNQSFRQWYSTFTDVYAQRDAYEATGKNISWNAYGALDPARATVPHYFDNYYFNAYENFSTDSRTRTFGNIELNYEVNDWLSVLGRLSTDRYSEIQEERIAVGSVDVSEYARFDRDFYENNFDLFLTADKYLGADNKIAFNAMIGTNIRRGGVESSRAQTNGGLIVPGVYALRNSVSPIQAPNEASAKTGVNGYFARATIGYDQLLYLDLTARNDIFSTLPDGNNSYLYPSASLSLVFSELLNTSVLDFGKIRLNYAVVGNGIIAANSINDTYALGTPFNGVPIASVPGQKNSDQLKPERTRNLEAGIEMKFLRNRLGIDLSVYQSTTFDQIIPVTVSGATGNTSKFVNAGEIDNKGIELAFMVTPVKTRDFSWDVAINWSRNRNKVVELFGDQTNLQLANVQGGITINATVGEPFGTIRGTNYVYHTDGSPIVYDHWNTGVRYRKTSTPEVIGDVNPDWRGGVNNRLRYKDFGLSFLIDIQRGGDFFSLDTWYGYATGVYDFTAGVNSNGGDVRALPADGGGIFIDGAVIETGFDDDGNPISDGTANTQAFYTSDVYSSLGYVYAPNAHHVYDASFAKLREVSFTYSFPSSLIEKTPFQALDVSLIGRNLWILDKNSPYSDPEAGLSAGNIQGYQSGAYPSVKEYGINLRVKF